MTVTGVLQCQAYMGEKKVYITDTNPMVPQASQHDQRHRNTSNCSLQYFTIWQFKHSVYFFTLLCPRFVLVTLYNENLYTGKIRESSMKLHLVHFQLHISFRNSLLMFYAEHGGNSTQYIKCTFKRERERERERGGVFGTMFQQWTRQTIPCRKLS